MATNAPVVYEALGKPSISALETMIAVAEKEFQTLKNAIMREALLNAITKYYDVMAWKEEKKVLDVARGIMGKAADALGFLKSTLRDTERIVFTEDGAIRYEIMDTNKDAVQSKDDASSFAMYRTSAINLDLLTAYADGDTRAREDMLKIAQEVKGQNERIKAIRKAVQRISEVKPKLVSVTVTRDNANLDAKMVVKEISATFKNRLKVLQGTK